jgi:hypothetical protein
MKTKLFPAFSMIDKKGIEKRFLLMPKEALEFLEVSERVSPHYAFERITGKSFNEYRGVWLSISIGEVKND